ncbi:MAG: ABC transporter ATP-binding protein [Oscillospiraceae bacterium]|nr:ABC transporter ATP-binding protein [Oscillospiraceae bacterium]MBQ2146386.1 ABC transporter ATP-binding protein [Oscillospiraceae bacterium]MBQ5489967.1 ABC transporter ATP-binding protein [Oscillospiraceae bacterium]
MIEVKKLVKTFGDFRALDGLDINVPSGAVYGLVGPNGAGKSTVIRHITGILKQDSGEVKVDGEDVYENTEVKEKIAYIPDDVFYYTQASVNDMMKFYRDMYPKFDMERFSSLGKVFGIKTSSPVRKLSRGMQKQVAFWLALSMRPETVVLDEPVDGLDPVMRRQVWNVLLSDVAENGTTVLISSHNLRELEDVCDHVGIMNKGKMMIERNLADLQESLVKVQLALPEGKSVPDGLDILHMSELGHLKTIIVRGSTDDVTGKLAAASPMFIDVLPLTLEEIFVYELGGAGYEVKDISI